MPSADERGTGRSRNNATQPFAIGTRKSRIENLNVPVVQRIEQGFPNAKTASLLEFAAVITSSQIALLERVELLLRSSRVIWN